MATTQVAATELAEGDVIVGASLPRLSTINYLVESIYRYDDGMTVAYLHNGDRSFYPPSATVTVLR